MNKSEFLKTMDYREQMFVDQLDARGLHSTHIPHWPVGSASTVFLWSKNLSKAQSEFIESEYYRKNQGFKPLATEPGPFFNIARGIWKGSPEFKTTAKKLGYAWSRSYRHIVFEKSRTFEIPKNYELQITEKLNKKDQQALVSLHHQGFGLTIDVWKQNYKNFAKTVSNIQFHNLWSPEGRLVGTGAIVYGKSSALAFSGVIAEGSRGQGLWNVMMGSRVNMALARGVRAVVIKTQNPLLIKKGDHNIVVDVFQQRFVNQPNQGIA